MLELRLPSSLPRRLWVEAAGLAFILVTWLVLGMGPLAVGPSEWDDHLYCELAISPTKAPELVFRYAHIYAMRLAVLAFGSSPFSRYALLVVVLVAIGSYLLARRLAGPVAGWIAAAMVPLYPAIYDFLDVPFSDVTMAAWSVFALVFAGLARDALEVGRSRAALAWLAAAGFACLWALKAKEVGAAVTPAVFHLVLRADTLGVPKVSPWRMLAAWGAGACLGLFALSVCDAVFLGDALYSWRPGTYGSRTASVPRLLSARAEEQMPAAPDDITSYVTPSLPKADFVSLLFDKEFFPWTLLGVAGLAGLYRSSPWTRTLTLWSSVGLVISSLVGVQYTGIYAAPRYAVLPGVALVVLGAAYLVITWRDRRHAPSKLTRSVAGGLVVSLLGLALLGRGSPESRAVFFLSPVLLVAAFGVTLVGDRSARRAGVIALAGTLLWTSWSSGELVHSRRRFKVHAWDEAARVVRLAQKRRPDKRVVVGVVGLDDPYKLERIRRRLNARSAGVNGRTEYRTNAQRASVVLTTPAGSKPLVAKGWKVVARGGEAPPKSRPTPGKAPTKSQLPAQPVVVLARPGLLEQIGFKPRQAR